MRGPRPSPRTHLGAALTLLAALPCAQITAHAYTADDRIRLARGTWLAPELIERIELSGAEDDVEAWAGAHAWPLVKDAHKSVLVLVVSDKVRQAWRENGTLLLGYATQRTSGGELGLRASPRKLTLPATGAAFTLVQRRSIEVPGTDGYLRVAIGDITDAQTLLTVAGADGRSFVASQSVRTGAAIEFDLGEERYVLVVKRLRNLLIGDDYADFALVPAARFRADRVEDLLQKIAASAVTFVREGKDYTGAEAAEHLRQKLAARGGVTTLEDFIVEIASRSSTSGNPYEIRGVDGTTQPAQTWLRQQAAELERRRAEGVDKKSK